ncbi:MAG: DUF3592 domain-containing protein [Anaerolineae bacterium]|uniref:DUF3592 domain-containing protein n=1 Tax=Thermoflexus sp. TaxID=1969742 RepID=UPI0025E89FD0|nr:DUF3592 domain-containing protein [Thermoflexus sp.]MCS7350851.1 DUF3592 domain-containing protein [Thermoflexus sp.]MDW8180302.1 DUF3592 domain-containing protein [Anaerolineae bacterium]
MDVILNPFRSLSGLWSGPLLALMGALIAYGGWAWRGHTQAMVGSAVEARGTVVRLVPQQTSEGNTLFYAEVEFTTGEGEVVRFRDSTGANPPAYRVGDTVRVLYDPRAPQAAVIDSWMLWLPSTALIALGGLFMFAGGMAFLQGILTLLGLGGLLGALAFLVLRRKSSRP